MTNYRIIGGDGRQYGPITAHEMRKWIGEGRLNAQSQVQLEGATEWQPLGTISEFADVFGGAATPPPVATPQNPVAWVNGIVAREADLRFGECFAAGFSFFAANPGFVIGSVFIAWFLNVAMGFLPFVGGIIHLLLAGVITGGLYLAALKRMRGETAGIGNIFDGFKLCFVQLMLVGAVSRILGGIGFVFCFLPGIYLMVAWIFALPIAADKRLEFWSAMELSRKITTRVWFQIFLLLLLVFLPFLAMQGIAGLKIGGYLYDTLRDANFDFPRWVESLTKDYSTILKLSVIWGLAVQVAYLVCQFFAIGALMRAYENLFGERKP